MKPFNKKLTASLLLGIGSLTATASVIAAETDVGTEDAEAATIQVGSSASGSCTPAEHWSYSEGIRARWRKEFDGLITTHFSTPRGFANAMAFRKQFSTDLELKAMGEYFLARSLLDAKMVHVAQSAFQSIVLAPPLKRTLGIQIAALGCLNQIHQKYPSLVTSASVQARLPGLVASLSKFAADQFPAAQREVVNFALVEAAQRQIADNGSKKEIKATLELLKGQGVHESLAQLFAHAKNSDHAGVITEGQKFLAEKLPQPYERFKDTAHILLSRSFYSIENYDASASHLKLVTRSSNELARGLEELSWAFLQAEKYPEAIGTAMNLQQGGLKNTFTPEAPMVMAMALNEICQYPSSVAAVASFKRRYEKPFKWLDHWAQEGADPSQSKLYKEAVRFLGKKSDVPNAIGTEWVRSPLFISSQDEINLLFDTRGSAKQFSASANAEQNKLAKSIVDDWRQLKYEIRDAKKHMKPGETLGSHLRDRIAELRYDIVVFQRIWNSAPIWASISEHHFQRSPSLERAIVKKINEDLSSRTLNLYTQIQEIAENNQLIEVEIYNGASQDIIWQNAHPEYKELAKALKEETRKKNAERVWDWGRAPAHAEDQDGGEIWEDELGSFRAEMVNNCESKDKYLALSRRKSE